MSGSGEQAPPTGLRRWGLRRWWQRRHWWIRWGERSGWSRGTRFAVVLAGSWFVFVLAHLLFSGVSYLWLLLDLAPPLIYLVMPLVLLLVAWRARDARRQLLVLAVGAGLLGAGLTGLNPHTLTGGGDGPAPAGALTVFSWNTGLWDQHDSPDEFYDFLRAQHADVYLLQEYIEWDETLNQDCLPTGPRPGHDRARIEKEFPGYEIAVRGELLTLSRLPIVDRPPVAPDWGRLPVEDWYQVFDRVRVLRTDVRTEDGQVMSFYNVHMPVQVGLRAIGSLGFFNDVAFADDARRQQFAKLAADVAANPHPVLVAGDFNTTPAMGDIGAMTGVATDALRASRDPYPHSWMAHSPIPLWRLDWTFTTDPVRVHDYSFVDVAELSDHRAQRVTVSLADGS